jgi:hypothetical protein
MSVKSREGRELVLRLADNLGVAVAKGASVGDIRRGDDVGSATRRSPDGEDAVVPGAYVFVSGQTGADGVATAIPVQVGKDGVRPPL